ncbi:GNAT family N-acetyltransferase, partial [Salinisphaera sp. USBA-960]|nr:GNAT family N-acetyltransferase [Salifodinibacter halophilus]
MQIRAGQLDRPEVIALLREHLQGMAELSPPESIHALDLDGLQRPEISFWSAWDGEDLLGCGALKQLDAGHGEIKSMRTAQAHRRRGVAAAMLEHLLEEAARREYRRLS